MAEKQLTEASWRSFAKGRSIKDATLLKALADLAAAERGTPDAQLKCLDSIDKQVQALLKLHKSDKEIAAYLGDVDKALGRARKAAEQAAKDAAKAAAKPDEGEDDDSPALLTTQLLPLLRLAMKGEPMHALLASAGKQVVVLLSRKPIPPSRRKLLAAELESSGAIKYYVGQCLVEDNAPTFVLQDDVAGMARKIKAALLAQTGLRLNKLRCRGAGGETDHDDDDAPQAAVADAAAAAAPATTGPPIEALNEARTGWGRARNHAVGELSRLKGLLTEAYRDAADEQAALARALKRLDDTIATLDDQLDLQLEQAIRAAPAQRGAVAAAARPTVERLLGAVNSDEVLQTIDGNELAPEMAVASALRSRLQEIAATLG